MNGLPLAFRMLNERMNAMGPVENQERCSTGMNCTVLSFEAGGGGGDHEFSST